MRFFDNILLNIKNECGILISRLCRNEEKIMPEVVLRPAEEEDIAEMLALYAPHFGLDREKIRLNKIRIYCL